MSYQDLMYDIFSDFDISIDIFGKEDCKDARSVKTLIQNKTLIITNIRKNVNAVITLSTYGTHGSYEGFKVEIIHKDNGAIASQWFAFKDHMPINCQVGNETKRVAYSIWDHDQTWYGSSPSFNEKQKIVKQIMKYIGTWT